MDGSCCSCKQNSMAFRYDRKSCSGILSVFLVTLKENFCKYLDAIVCFGRTLYRMYRCLAVTDNGIFLTIFSL